MWDDSSSQMHPIPMDRSEKKGRHQEKERRKETEISVGFPDRHWLVEVHSASHLLAMPHHRLLLWEKLMLRSMTIDVPIHHVALMSSRNRPEVRSSHPKALLLVLQAVWQWQQENLHRIEYLDELQCHPAILVSWRRLGNVDLEALRVEWKIADKTYPNFG